jgi:N-methylhydantoinase A
MMAFGGAGPIHAAAVAQSLGIRRVLIPPAPGVFSAFGLLRAEIEHHAARTVLASTRGGDLAKFQSVIDTICEDLRQRMAAEGYEADSVRLMGAADLRYRGQSSEITVPLTGLTIDEAGLRALEERFEAEFELTYGHRGDYKDFELVTLRVVATVPREVEHGMTCIADAMGSVGEDDRRRVYFGRELGSLEIPVLTRQALQGGARSGPLLIQEYDTTTVVPPRSTASLDSSGNIVIDIED